jgi:hypothetical protein
MAEEKIFADGFLFKRKETAPEFVIGSLSLKVDEAIAFIKNNSKNGWVNLDIKQARSGNYYLELDTFEPKAKGDAKAAPAKATKPAAKQAAEDDDDEVPF